MGTVLSPIYFKLFTFPSQPGTGVVAIRGSQTAWDWMVNMQLWSASGLAQLVKWLTPYGWIWTPVLDDLVSFVNIIQSNSLKKVSYYTVTTDFVNSISSTYDSLRITGASLNERNSIHIIFIKRRCTGWSFDNFLTFSILSSQTFPSSHEGFWLKRDWFHKTCCNKRKS